MKIKYQLLNAKNFVLSEFKFNGATQLYKAGVPLDTIRYYLEHSTIEMTEHYLRLTPEDTDNDIINSVLDRSSKVKHHKNQGSLEKWAKKKSG